MNQPFVLRKGTLAITAKNYFNYLELRKPEVAEGETFNLDAYLEGVDVEVNQLGPYVFLDLKGFAEDETNKITEVVAGGEKAYAVGVREGETDNYTVTYCYDDAHEIGDVIDTSAATFAEEPVAAAAD